MKSVSEKCFKFHRWFDSLNELLRFSLFVLIVVIPFAYLMNFWSQLISKIFLMWIIFFMSTRIYCLKKGTKIK